MIEAPVKPMIEAEVPGGARRPAAAATAERLIHHLERQQAIYCQLRELADRQRSLVVGDDPRPLLTVLADRQRLVDELTRCNAMLAPFRREWLSLYSSFDGVSRQRVQHLLEENDRILSTIMRSDQEDAEVLRRRQAETRAQLDRSENGIKANRMYTAVAPGVPTLTDTQA